MTRLKTTAAVTGGLAAVVLVLTAAHTSAATLRGSGGSPSGREKAHHEHLDAAFRIGGSVGGLYPGDSATLILTVTNPQHFAIVVTSISTTVGSPKPGCGAGYLTVAGFSGKLVVGARSSQQVSVQATLSHAAPDPCQGVVFPLHYDGLAKKG